MENFTISSTNPNQETGGAGCLCYPDGSRDCQPPYVVFHGDELLDPLSPHAVACRGCVSRALERMDTEETVPVGDIPAVLEPESRAAIEAYGDEIVSETEDLVVVKVAPADDEPELIPEI